ncbi:MAG: sensor histidine kinase, partial [Microcystaceae cyanobacterium]
LGFASVIQNKLQKTIFPALTVPTPKIEKATHQIQNNLQIIVSEAERLTLLINQVLDIAKMESGNMELNIQSHSPQKLLCQAIAAITPLFEQKGLALTQEFEPDLPDIAVDGDRLIQVILNLLSNALKFTKEGQVICRVKKEAEDLLISVKDTGMGVPFADQERIFDPFQQGGNILTDKPQGTGLGLPICKQIVESHGGKIWLISKPNQGSEFNLIIPLFVTHSQ